jgi:hypothetical protein
MGIPQLYIAIMIVVLAVVAALVFLVGRGAGENKLTPLAGVAWACILGGLMFGDHRGLGYTLLAAGVVLAVVDMLRRLKRT